MFSEGKVNRRISKINVIRTIDFKEKKFACSTFTSDLNLFEDGKVVFDKETASKDKGTGREKVNGSNISKRLWWDEERSRLTVEHKDLTIECIGTTVPIFNHLFPDVIKTKIGAKELNKDGMCAWIKHVDCLVNGTTDLRETEIDVAW